MTGKKNLGNAAAIEKLAKKLDGFRQITNFDGRGEKQAWTIAHALADIEESAVTFVQDCLPKLKRAESEEEVLDALNDVGEELRHILYHIKDVRFYAYLIDEREIRRR